MEVNYVFLWYLVLLLASFIALPVTNHFFGKWKDKGYGLSKFIGLFMVAMPLWFLSSLRIISFSSTSVWVFILIGFTFSLVYLKKHKFKPNRLMLLQEGTFLVIYLIWAYIRSYNSVVEGTEKFMNLAIMNSVDRTEYFPPLDMWFSGSTINYYYLGHYVFVFIGKAIESVTTLSYNLALISIIAATFTGIISISLRLLSDAKQKVGLAFAYLGAIWISFGGNMHYIFCRTIGVLLEFDYCFSDATRIISNTKFVYFFPDATRIISNTINEFPAYSIVLGDLHGHYIALPYLLATLAFGLALFETKVNDKKRLILTAMVSPFLVALYGINSWDFITCVFILSLLNLVQVFSTRLKPENKFKLLIKLEAALLLPGLVLMLPYLLNFKPPVGGIGIVPLGIKSEPLPWLLMWGMFILISGLFFAKTIISKYKFTTQQVFSVLLFLVATLLILGVEFIYVRDIFETANPPYFRTNTVFKFYYHAWIIWGLAAIYFAYNVLAPCFKQKQNWKFVLIIPIMIAFIAFYAGSVSYIFKAVEDFYPIKSPNLVTLDGMQHIKKNHPGDFEAIAWINQNIEGQPVILEANGNAYTYFDRITAHTGLVTPVGWATHEWQWRGTDMVDIIFSRANDIRYIYEATDINTARALINKYSVKYIVVGEKEFEAYPALNEVLIKQLASLVFEDTYKTTRIYKVN